MALSGSTFDQRFRYMAAATNSQMLPFRFPLSGLLYSLLLRLYRVQLIGEPTFFFFNLLIFI